MMFHKKVSLFAKHEDKLTDLLVKEHRKRPFTPAMFPAPVTVKLYGPDCVGRLHTALLKKAGITENIRFHDLRHTHTTTATQKAAADQVGSFIAQAV